MNTSAEDTIRPEKYAHGHHPNSRANLRPYKPGENGHGRVYPLKERLRHALDKPLAKPGPNACAGDVLVYSSLTGAIERESTPFKEVWDRVEGKVPQATEITGKDGGPVVLVTDEQLAAKLQRMAGNGNPQEGKKGE